jgi:hypothetical protein
MVDGHDPDTGELLVPVIYLWLTKDGVSKPGNVGGAMKSGTEVEIIRRDPDGWVRIVCDIRFNDKTYPQRGYVRKSLIKEVK